MRRMVLSSSPNLICLSRILNAIPPLQPLAAITLSHLEKCHTSTTPPVLGSVMENGGFGNVSGI